jgi:hypothetical protein
MQINISVRNGFFIGYIEPLAPILQDCALGALGHIEHARRYQPVLYERAMFFILDEADAF